MKPERDLATYADVRNKVVGYNDAALTATKSRLAEEPVGGRAGCR